MAVRIKLYELVDALELPEGWGVYFDRESGRVLMLDPETLAAGDEEEESLGGAAPVEELAAARAIETGDPRYLALPDRFDFHEYRHMERFVAGVADAGIADQLWRAIKGKGAFRHFKDTAHRLGLLDRWYQYRQQAMEEFMADWAEANGIAVDASPRPGGPGPK
jgi:hypothetical protein